MTSSVVSFRSLKSLLDGAISEIADPRAPSNATSYRLRDALLGAFGCFFMQSASFLDYQRQLNSVCTLEFEIAVSKRSTVFLDRFFGITQR